MMTIEAMSKLRFVGSLSALLGLVTALSVGCSSAEDAPSSAGGASAGADDGQPGQAGNSGAGGADDGHLGGAASAGETASGGAEPSGLGGETSEGGAPSTNVTIDPSSGPCRYSATGEATFPTGSVLYICTNNSRIFQSNGDGEYEVLLGAGFAIDAGGSSTLACSISSDSAPAAGDTWVMNSDAHPGGCDLSFMDGGPSRLWTATTSPTVGDVTIKFGELTLTHGATKPTDVYYLGEVTFSGTLHGMSGATQDVQLTGSYQIKMTPLGA